MFAGERAVPSAVQVQTEAPPSPASFLLMVPGAFVRIRYKTTQYGSVSGTEWRCVKVQRAGLVCETDFGRADDFRAGWWCYHMTVLKFFLLSRILEIQSWSEGDVCLPYKDE